MAASVTLEGTTLTRKGLCRTAGCWLALCRALRGLLQLGEKVSEEGWGRPRAETLVEAG